jgi:hypothetical protein
MSFVERSLLFRWAGRCLDSPHFRSTPEFQIGTHKTMRRSSCTARYGTRPAVPQFCFTYGDVPTKYCSDVGGRNTGRANLWMARVNDPRKVLWKLGTGCVSLRALYRVLLFTVLIRWNLCFTTTVPRGMVKKDKHFEILTCCENSKYSLKYSKILNFSYCESSVVFI